MASGCGSGCGGGIARVGLRSAARPMRTTPAPTCHRPAPSRPPPTSGRCRGMSAQTGDRGCAIRGFFRRCCHCLAMNCGAPRYCHQPIASNCGCPRCPSPLPTPTPTKCACCRCCCSHAIGPNHPTLPSGSRRYPLPVAWTWRRRLPQGLRGCAVCIVCIVCMCLHVFACWLHVMCGMSHETFEPLRKRSLTSDCNNNFPLYNSNRCRCLLKR